MNQTQIQESEEFFSKLMAKCQAENWNSIPTEKLLATIKHAFKYKTDQSSKNALKYYCDIGLLQAGVSGYLITEAAKKKYWGEKHLSEILTKEDANYKAKSMLNRIVGDEAAKKKYWGVKNV